MIRSMILPLCLIGTLAATGAVSQVTLNDCHPAGERAVFCAADRFSELNLSPREGETFWMHSTGFLSKVLVETVGDAPVTQAQIETQILAIVTAQAAAAGRDFEFVDLASSAKGGMPFGTLRYDMQSDGRVQPILHSYVAVDGVVVQVISQIGMTNASTAQSALAAAHSQALRAVRLVGTQHPAQSDT